MQRMGPGFKLLSEYTASYFLQLHTFSPIMASAPYNMRRMSDRLKKTSNYYNKVQSKVNFGMGVV